MGIGEYVDRVQDKVGEIRTQRAQRKLDRRMERYIRSAHIGDSEGNADFEDNWLTYSPGFRDTGENVEGARKTIEEIRHDLEQRGYEASDSEVAVRLIDRFSNEASDDFGWAHSVASGLDNRSYINTTVENARKRVANAKEYASMVNELADQYNLTEKGFEEHPYTLALLTDQTDRARNYREADSEEKRQQIRDDIEENARTYISDRVEEAQAISQEADQVQEKLENAEDNVYENFREMMENDPETYASLRQEYGYNDTADDIREEVKEHRQ